MKVIGFAGSTSKNSINKELVKYVGTLLPDVEFELLDLNDYEMSIYSIDRENENGIPEKANIFLSKINDAQGLVISLAEHNGNFATGLKNVLDWVSRINMFYLENKPLLLMATSPGAYGARSVLEIGRTSFGFAKGKVVDSFSLPYFFDNFQEGKISNEELDNELREKVNTFYKSLEEK